MNTINMIALTDTSIFTGEHILEGYCVLVEGGLVSALVPEADVPAGIRRTGLQGALLAPAFIDLQVNGGHGMLFSEHPSAEALEAMRESCLEGGTSLFLPTAVTNDSSVIFRAIEAVKQYRAKGGSGVAGLHVEGPYLNPAKRGAHLAQYIRKPEADEIRSLLEAGRGVITKITLAPELCSNEVLDLLLDEGIILSAGHSDASYEQASAAFEKGVAMATHLYNAMSGLHHRAPGLVGAVLDSRAMASIIADGFHVAFPVIRISKKIMGPRLFLITDAVAENHSGHYLHQFDGEKFTLPDGTLSGAAITMLGSVRNCVEKAGISLEEALRMASLYPAQVLKKDTQYGKIQSGYRADLVAIGEGFRLKGVWQAGNLAWSDGS